LRNIVTASCWQDDLCAPVVIVVRGLKVRQSIAASIASSYHDQCARARNIFIASLRYEGRCLTRAAEPPVDQFGTLAWPAHSQRESWCLGGRHRPAPGFPDHWAGCRTETI